MPSMPLLAPPAPWPARWPTPLMAALTPAPRTGSQFFKFQVNNPLSMRSKTHALSLNNEVLIETH